MSAESQLGRGAVKELFGKRVGQVIGGALSLTAVGLGEKMSAHEFMTSDTFLAGVYFSGALSILELSKKWNGKEDDKSVGNLLAINTLFGMIKRGAEMLSPQIILKAAVDPKDVKLWEWGAILISTADFAWSSYLVNRDIINPKILDSLRNKKMRKDILSSGSIEHGDIWARRGLALYVGDDFLKETKKLCDRTDKVESSVKLVRIKNTEILEFGFFRFEEHGANTRFVQIDRKFVNSKTGIMGDTPDKV